MPADSTSHQTPRDWAARAILEAGDTGVLAVQRGQILYANPTASRILDCNALEGSRLREVAPALAGLSLDSANDTEVLLSAGGSRRPVRLWVLRQTDSDAVILMIRDTSAFRDIESRLRERTRLFESIVESLPFDFWVNDLENRTVLQNSFSRRLWGEQYGVHMRDVQSDRHVLEQWERTNQQALSGRLSVGEITYHLDDQTRSFRNIVGPIRDGEQIIGIFGVNIDITDLKQALSDRELLLQELNHRVKNHLQMIISLVQLQQSRAANEDLRRLEERVHAIYHVHDQLHEDHSLETIDLDDYFERLISGLTAGYGRELDLQSSCGGISISYQRAVSFGIVSTELLVNAFKHGDTAGPVTVRLTRSPEEVELRVRNRLCAPPGSTMGGLAIMHHVAGQLRGSLSNAVSDTHYEACLRFPIEQMERNGTMG